jgi:hypothetical protein
MDAANSARRLAGGIVLGAFVFAVAACTASNEDTSWDGGTTGTASGTTTGGTTTGGTTTGGTTTGGTTTGGTTTGGTTTGGTTTGGTTTGGTTTGGTLSNATYAISWDPLVDPKVTGYKVYFNTAPIGNPGKSGQLSVPGHSSTSVIFQPGTQGILVGESLFVAISSTGAGSAESTLSSAVSVTVQ